MFSREYYLIFKENTVKYWEMQIPNKHTDMFVPIYDKFASLLSKIKLII